MKMLNVRKKKKMGNLFEKKIIQTRLNSCHCVEYIYKIIPVNTNDKLKNNKTYLKEHKNDRPCIA